MREDHEAESCVGLNWEALAAAEDTGASAGPVGDAEARLVALAHLELADGLWHRAGAGPVTLAHRLAAATLYALIYEDTRNWRLSPVIRDIVVLGESVLPDSLDALEMRIQQVVDGTPIRPIAERLAGDRTEAERRFRDVVRLASRFAREATAVP